MKVRFITFGCRLNKAEALQMEADYLSEGWETTDDSSEADLFVVRGCSVTAKAQRDCEKFIAALRREFPETPLRLCGCLEKDLQTADPLEIEAAGSPIPLRTARAYLKVQDGCAGKCTFCIVPHFRGPSKSESFVGLLDRAKRFVDSGYREIVVVGCNLSLYASEGKRLPDLLAALASVSSGCRIRLGSLEPGGCALETVRVMAERENICRFLHLPIQSGSDAVLRTMRRPYTLSDVEEVVNTACTLLPQIGLGCDLMTGFPGETEADHAATRDLLVRLPFSNAHVFPYSERPGTPAATFRDAVAPSVRQARAHDLSDLAREKRNVYASSFVGKTAEIVVENAETSAGWTGEYLWCEADGPAPRKSLQRIRVEKAEGDRLYGIRSPTASRR